MNIDSKACNTFTLTGHSCPYGVRSVSTFTDAKTDKVYIVSGSDDQTIKIWDASDGTCVKTLTGHTIGVLSVSTFTDAKTDIVFIISGSWDKTIKVWDVSDGTCVKTLTGHTGLICCVSTFPDVNRKQKEQALYNELIDYLSKDIINHFVLPYAIPPTFNIVSGSIDNTVRIWPISAAVTTSQEQPVGQKRRKLNNSHSISIDSKIEQ